MLEVVCGVIGNADGEFLTCLRPAGKHLAGLWEFPGGKVDPGETPEAALIRELREELSVEVAVGAALVPVVWSYGEKTIRLSPFFCRIISGELQATEHEELRWCSRETYQNFEWAGADIPILEEVFPSNTERKCRFAP